MLSKIIAKGTARVAKAARKQKPKKKTETTAEASRAEQQIERELRTADVARGSRKPSVTVGSKSEAGGVVEESTSKGAKARAKEIVRLQTLVRQGEATKADKAKLKRMQDKDTEDLQRRNVRISQSLRGRKKEVDNFAVALRKAKETGELGEEFDKLTKKQQDAIIRSVKITQNIKDPDKIAKEMLEKRKPKDKDVKMGKVILGTRKADMGKGGQVTKSRTGPHDYRMNKGGLLLSSVDNRKKK